MPADAATGDVERTSTHREVRTLEIDELPIAARSKLMVEVVRDGLGQPVSIPVIVARGARSGPTFGLTSTLHGNELNGIPVIHRLLDRIDLQRLRGTVVAVVVVNVPGFLARQRWYTGGVDLNHIMPGVAGGSAPQVFANRFVERFLSKFEYLIDLHTASSGRVNSIYVRADMTHPVTAEMAYRQRPQIIVHNPPSDRTLRGVAMERGIAAITVEIGNPHRFQPGHVKATISGIRSVLAQVGMLPRRHDIEGAEPVLCGASSWMYTDYGGLLHVLPDVAQFVEAGEVIARLTDAFGDVTREYRAPRAGIVIGKSVDPVAETGARILHLGLPAETGRFLNRDQLQHAREKGNS